MMLLRRFEQGAAAEVAGWPASPEDLMRWCARTDFPLAPRILEEWHGATGILPFILDDGEEAVGYGELWTEPGATDIELARLLIRPDRRGKGMGRLLVSRLIAEATLLGGRRAVLRVFEDNAAAIACYARAGFIRFHASEEAAFNAGERFKFVWMAYPLPAIRRAKAADAVRLASIDACWETSPRWTEAQYREEEQKERAVSFVAETDGEVAGFVFAWLVAAELQIHNVAVAPDAVRRGLGRALLKAALAEGARRGATEAHLEVMKGNDPAVRLYESEGFRVVATRPNFYHGQRDALLMSRSLP